MIKLLTVGAIVVAMGLILLRYKEERNMRYLLIAGVLLGMEVSLGIVGNMMRSVSPLFLTHIVALIIGYIGVLSYILKERFYWYLSFAPVATLLLYLLLSWLGNEHI